MQRLQRLSLGSLALAGLLALSACGGGDAGGPDIDLSNDRGSLQRNPPTQLAALSAAAFSASLQASASGQSLLTLTTGSATGTLPCGIDLRYIQYGTVGGAGERTNATGALMIPTGGAGCSGARPVVLYAHGTTIARDFNLALLGSSNAAASEAALVAAVFAARGYIVIAPNYAGYDGSALGYHPYLNADQQAKDLSDALTAGRAAVSRIANGTSDNGRLLVTGYSQGGHAAMAAARALRAAGQTVTAFAGGSGPYALSAFVDDIFGDGTVAPRPLVGGTLFTPLLSTSWKRSYAAQPTLSPYGAATELYTDAYASGIETLLPGALSTTQLFTATPPRLPQSAMFGIDLPGFGSLDLADPVDQGFAALFGAPNAALIRSSYGIAVQADRLANPCPRTTGATGPLDCAPAHPLRAAARLNDLRNWTPSMPLLMCGGSGDPTVAYSNTVHAAQYFSDIGRAALVTLLDVAAAPTGATDPFAAAKVGFQTTLAGIVAAAGSDPVAQATARATNYHSTVAPFCVAAAEGFFRSVLAATP